MTFLQRRRPQGPRSVRAFHSSPTSYPCAAELNARVSFRRREILRRFSSINVCPSLGATRSRPWPTSAEGHRNDIPLPVGGVAGRGSSRVQDSHRIDMDYQGIIDYRPRLHGVSIFHLTATGSPYDQLRPAIEPRIYVPGCRTCARYPGTNTAECLSEYRFMLSR
jgi:hypothetical protein